MNILRGPHSLPCDLCLVSILLLNRFKLGQKLPVSPIVALLINLCESSVSQCAIEQLITEIILMNSDANSRRFRIDSIIETLQIGNVNLSTCYSRPVIITYTDKQDHIFINEGFFMSSFNYPSKVTKVRNLRPSAIKDDFVLSCDQDVLKILEFND